MNFVELFSGSGTMTREFQRAGHNTFSVDIRKRKGKCEPHLRKDILDMVRSDIPFNHIDVLWLSLPCDIWSYAAGSVHWNKEGLPRTEKCMAHIHILEKSLAVIQECSPGLFFIENPRGRLRHYPRLLDFLAKHEALIKVLTLSSYGFHTTKPTNLFTNAKDYTPKELDRFGRGAKVKRNFSNMTKCQRQKLLSSLAIEIREYCEEHIRPKGIPIADHCQKDLGAYI